MALGSREKQLGDILVEQGVISPLQLDEALQRQRLTGDMLGRVLVTMGLCEEQDIIESLGVQSGMERVELSRLKISEEVIRTISSDVARFYNVIPIRKTGNRLIVAMADPLNLQVLDDLQQITGLEIQGAVSNQQDVTASWKNNYSIEGDSIHSMLIDLQEKVGMAELTMDEQKIQQVTGDVDNLVELAQQPEVIKIVNLIFLEAVQKRASDIHMEVYEDNFRIRIRVDGILQEIVCPPKNLAIAMVSRIKVISNMDISERRMPQDNRIELKVGDTVIDVRVSTLPVLHGESVVMRILDRNAVKHDLIALGFPQDIFTQIDEAIQKPNGIVLVTGPTGSGKTTTLYGCLNMLNQPGVKIITTEDPVEFQIDRLIQCNVNDDVGLTFARCLRSILRQDPDIVMVGEIRDLETAQIAVEASLTGHLVLSTIHTNSAPETITRLLDMDVEPFLIAASLEAVLAQRLCRKVCRFCKEPYVPDEAEMDDLGVPEAWRRDAKFKLVRATGCVNCEYAGYNGRTGLYEMITVDEGIRDLVLESATSLQLRRYCRKHLGMITLREAALMKAVQGITTAAEVLYHTDSYED